MTRVAVLLRGVNVGAAARVAMADLRASLEDDGMDVVQTILQSGNVVVEVPAAQAGAAARRVADAASRLTGGDVRALAVPRAALRAALDDNPLWTAGKDGARMATAFSSEPAAPIDAPTGGLPRLGGGAVHVASASGLGLTHQWCPDGLSKAPPLERLVRFPKGAVVTVRNRNTVAKILGAVEGG
ncbi:MAG: DUF1697 domain-containing protein [Thermoleophilia bacterium]|nr:DUF1697 domain-containing protein [Thermoleophilia bacterium]